MQETPHTQNAAVANLAQRVRTLQPSATVAIAQRARELKAQGVDVLSFSVGEPDFPTPTHICQAAQQAIDAGATRYTAVRGTAELRAAIARDSARRRPGTEYTPEEIVVSVGAKHSLFNLAMALFESGDEVIIPAPYWVSYPAQVRLSGAEPVIVASGADTGFRLQPAQLQAALSPRTKAVLLCTPSNPTGAAYNRTQLLALIEVLRAHHCWIIVDEIYGQLVYGDFQQHSIAELAPDLKSRLVIVDGVSKSHAMTGWRIGWMLAPKALASACDTFQGQATTNAAAVSQAAAVAALDGPQDALKEMRAAFTARRQLATAGLAGIAGIEAQLPDGAFYVFCQVAALCGRQTPDGHRLHDDIAVARYLLDEARCALVPGTAFGAPGHLRFSYATDNDTITTGIQRIAAAVAKLGG